MHVCSVGHVHIDACPSIHYNGIAEMLPAHSEEHVQSSDIFGGTPADVQAALQSTMARPVQRCTHLMSKDGARTCFAPPTVLRALLHVPAFLVFRYSEPVGISDFFSQTLTLLVDEMRGFWSATIVSTPADTPAPVRIPVATAVQPIALPTGVARQALQTLARKLFPLRCRLQPKDVVVVGQSAA